MRIAECCWLAGVGLMCLGADTPYPWCQACDRWMDESSSVRLKYGAVSTGEVRTLAEELVDGQYIRLLKLEQPVDAGARGLDVSTYGCPGCDCASVLDIRWYRSQPDAQHTETEQLLEAAAGTQVISRLKVPAEIHTHIQQLAERAAA